MPSNRRKNKGSRERRRENVRVGNHLAVHRDSTEGVTQQELNPEQPSTSQEFLGCSGSDSLAEENGESTKHCLQEDQEACCETTRENCDRDSPMSLSEDSGFTSSQGNDSYRNGDGSSHPAQDTEGVSALRKFGIELNQEGASRAAAFPKRPGKGTLGKKIKLISNCYPIKFPSGNVYHYDIEVTRFQRSPEPGADAKSKKYRCLRTIEKRSVVERMVLRDAAFRGIYPAYDGEQNLITRRPLSVPFPHEFTTDYEDGTNVRVRIKPVKKEGTMSCAISLDAIRSYFEKESDSLPKKSIMALETILRHTPCLTEIPIGRSFFSPPGPGCQNPLSGGLEIWFGYHQSMRIGEWGPTVNLDVSATVFYPGGPLLDYMAKYLNTTIDSLRHTPFLADRDRNRLNKKLIGRKVETIHSHVKRKYTVIGLVRENAHNNLHTEEGGPTIAQYFNERYGITLEFPNFPCLRVNPRTRMVLLPVELCRLVPGQHYNHQLTSAQTSEMIKFTCSAPKQRFQKIENIRRGLFEGDRCAQEFGLQISKNPVDVYGRTLDNPSLIYGSDKKIQPREGGFWSMRGVKFFNGAVVHSWALLAFRGSVPTGMLNTFGSLLKDMGLNLGLRIKNPDYTGYIDLMNTRNFLSNMKKKQEIDLAVIVIPEDDDVTTYREVKKSAETVVGLITQCIRARTVRKITAPNSRGSGQLLANLFLKINAKMKGVNYSLVLSEIPSLLWNPIIVMGADVNHPGAYRGIKESLAAVSGSLDARCSIYAVRTMPQRPEDDRKGSSEIICDFQSMAIDLMRAFYKHTRKKPEKIIVYRDGVSEGEFLKVRNEEVNSLRKACRDLGQDYEPGITYIVVQKRHHVRFTTERTKLNPPNGTVIDEGVTHPEYFDFFLFSQTSGKGTARPSHYTVLADDNGFTADELQKFTNQLCFCNVRCTKSMSIPVPVAYAHLAAYRARKYLDADRDGFSSISSDSGSRTDHRTTLDDSIESTRVVQEMKNRMYFV